MANKGQDALKAANTARTRQERKNLASKAGKASGEARRNYASWRECFKQRMTSDQMDQMYDKLWALFYKSNNLNALEVLLKGLDDGAVTTNNINVTFASQEMEEYGD